MGYQVYFKDAKAEAQRRKGTVPRPFRDKPVAGLNWNPVLLIPSQVLPRRMDHVGKFWPQVFCLRFSSKVHHPWLGTSSFIFFARNTLPKGKNFLKYRGCSFLLKHCHLLTEKGKVFEDENGATRENQDGAWNKKRRRKRTEGAERKPKKSWVGVCAEVGTGNDLEKHFQSFVICFLYNAYGLH